MGNEEQFFLIWSCCLFFLFELQYLAGCVGSKEQFFLTWGCCLFSSLNFNIWLFVRAVGNSFSYSLLALGGLCAASWKHFFLLTIGSGGPLCGQLEAVFLTHYWLWGAFVRAVGSSFSYSLLAMGGLCAGSWKQLLALGGLSAGSWKQFSLLTIGSGAPLCGQLEQFFYSLLAGETQCGQLEAVFLTHYWLGGALCGQLEAVFLLTIGWGDFVRAVGSSFSYSLLARGGLVRAVRSSFLCSLLAGET